MDSKKCLVCGDMFFKQQNQSKKYWSKKKYCSVKCSLVFTTIKKQANSENPGIGHTPWNKGMLGVHLSRGTEFMKGHPSNLGRNFPQISGENHPHWKPKQRKVCKQCNKEMLLAPWQTKKNRSFCSIACYGLWHRGKNSPVYVGKKAISKFRSRVSQLPEYVAWRKAVLERDKWTCQGCRRVRGKERVELEVDHIKRFYHIVKDHNLKTIEDARSCKELWDISNGRILCRACHRKSNTYGTSGLKKLLAQ